MRAIGVTGGGRLSDGPQTGGPAGRFRIGGYPSRACANAHATSRVRLRTIATVPPRRQSVEQAAAQLLGDGQRRGRRRRRR
ncbi:MAG: hypothetical protein ACXVUX_04820, partial [Solirubrobacteraceae bacterium]